MEFLPWSEYTLNQCLNSYNLTGQLCILDIELGGMCNFRCQYCDTPRYGHDIEYDYEQIERLAIDGGVKWIFVCGLGEPTVGNNMAKMKKLLDFCYKHSIKCSAFSNIYGFDEEILSYVKNGVLFPMFKLDSFSPETISQIYRIPKNMAVFQLEQVHRLVENVKYVDGFTNICASIVPSSMNEHCLTEVIDWCFAHNVFPLLGDLEDAGKGQRTYHSMKLNNEKLQVIRDFIKRKTGDDYKIPICPSVLFGIHIAHDGYITIDAVSGLSCHWFWLTEPRVEKLTPIANKSFADLSNVICEARKIRRFNVKNIMMNRKRLIFGGCGGDVVDLLKFYINRM